MIGSTRKSATSSRRSSASSASRSLCGTCTNSGRSGWKRRVKAGSPEAESEPSVRPWKPRSTETTRERPVAARPILIAASAASVPLLVKRTRPRLAGARRSSASARSPSAEGNPSPGSGAAEAERCEVEPRVLRLVKDAAETPGDELRRGAVEVLDDHGLALELPGEGCRGGVAAGCGERRRAPEPRLVRRRQVPPAELPQVGDRVVGLLVDRARAREVGAGEERVELRRVIREDALANR